MSKFLSAADPKAVEILAEFATEFKKSAGSSLPGEIVEKTRSFIREDHPAGYRVFYELMRGWRMPRHTYAWADNTYEAHEADEGSGAEAFRGSTKTSTMTEGFTMYRMALEPHKSNLFVQASDDQATKHAANVAHHIESNPMWKVLFPYVEPDYERGWSRQGYWLKRTDMDYGQWARMRDKDPTLVGAGYTAKIVTGSHPSGVFTIDDINNDANTESARQSEEVNRIIRDTLFPMEMPTTWMIFNQTPWTPHDGLAFVKATDTYRFVRTPVFHFLEDDEGESRQQEEDVVYYDRFNSWVELTWPQKFDLAEIERRYGRSGAIGFARMYLLDLERAKGQILRKEWLGRFPHEHIDPTWPQFIGVDYASASDRELNNVDRSYTSICWGRVTPQGTLVIEDGLFGRWSQQQSYQRLISIVETQNRLQQVGIEAIGKGEEFVSIMRMAPIWMPIMPVSRLEGQARSKGGRYEKVLAPAFERGDIMVSDRMTEWLKAFEDDWIGWNGDPKASRTDLLDSVYILTKAAEGFIRTPQLQPAMETEDWRERNLRVNRGDNPFAGIRDHHG